MPPRPPRWTTKMASVADHAVVGKVGRVTGKISPGRIGEVMVPVRGATEAYHAYATDDDVTIPAGRKVLIVEHLPPRTVIVTTI